MKTATLIILAISAAAQTHDTTAPTLTAFTFTPTSADATTGPATIAFSFSATDDLSGITSVQILIVGPSPSGVTLSASWNGAAGTATTQTIALTLPQYSAAGAWKVAAITLTDAVGNSRTLNTAALTIATYPTAITIS